MKQSREAMIAAITDDLEPVSPLGLRKGLFAVGAAVLATIALVAMIEGLWSGFMEGQAKPFFWLVNGLLMVLGISAATGAVTMASPHVGHRQEGPKWASAMVALLPIVAVIGAATSSAASTHLIDDHSFHCLFSSLVAAILTAGVLVWWLRRGAPVSVNPAGWLTGLASGALGTVAYGLSCALDTMGHLGIWHVAPVAIAAVLGRLIVPSFVRW